MKRKPAEGQMSLFDIPLLHVHGCGDCVCKTCLMWWSSRCPYGGCYDDYRATANPYDKAHPNEPPRTAWTDWEGDQAHWCRGAAFYPSAHCDHYVKYLGSVVSDCLGANVQRFQDGFMRCGYGEIVDCETCYKQFIERLEERP